MSRRLRPSQRFADWFGYNVVGFVALVSPRVRAWLLRGTR